jgi:ubiquitin-associated SH3 domain-containing protein
VGPLADQINTYFEAAKTNFHWNPAMDYMPHCSLTGFFHDHVAAAPLYTRILDDLFAEGRLILWNEPVLRVTGTVFHDDFHGLTLKSNWLIYLAERFRAEASAAALNNAIRLKEWLHLSFAYQFKPEENKGLEALAKRMITPDAPAVWEVRFYQHHQDKRWTCYGRWPLHTAQGHQSHCPKPGKMTRPVIL